MLWNLTLLAFFVVFIGSALLSFVNKKDKRDFDKPIQNFLIANGTLRSRSVISLLLSTSFGLNYLFYQIWAGYTIGIWSLISQAAWVIGLVLLGKFAHIVKDHTSLHELLGDSFGKSVRVTASICSIVGMLFMMGWETGIGATSFAQIYSSSSDFNSITSTSTANLIIAFILFGSLFYTVIGGLKGNANVDILLNCVKTLLVFLAAIFLFNKFYSQHNSIVFNSIFPSLNTVNKNFGISGFITSVLFSIVWQFVDNSTWQTLRAGSHETDKETKSDLFWTGIAAFIAPGIIGTILGISLISEHPIPQSDIFSEIIKLSPVTKGIAIFSVFALIISCIMSLVDGLFLNTAYTFVIDFLHPEKSIDDMDRDKKTSHKTLLLVRFLLVLSAVAGLWGTKFIYQQFNLQIFDCFYLMMIPQLGLIGPIALILVQKRVERFTMSVVLAIVVTVILSYLIFYIGNHYSIAWISDGTGTFEILFSILITLIFTRTPQKILK